MGGLEGGPGKCAELFGVWDSKVGAAGEGGGGHEPDVLSAGGWEQGPVVSGQPLGVGVRMPWGPGPQ